MAAPLVLICSVRLEADPVLERGTGWVPAGFGAKSAWGGAIAGRSVVVVVGGMGKTNAAHALTAALERERGVVGVIGFGVGGAYPGSGAATGAIALADREIYGDEGVAAPGGWMGTDGIGIPLLERPGSPPVFNEIPLQAEHVQTARQSLRTRGLEPVVGPFVTVSCCSGTTEAGRRLRERFGAVCETMEGAAYAHVAALYDLPYVGVRGISNQVEDRELGRWRLHDAAVAAGTAVEAIAGGWSR